MGTDEEYREKLRHRCDDPDCWECECRRELNLEARREREDMLRENEDDYIL